MKFLKSITVLITLSLLLIGCNSSIGNSAESNDTTSVTTMSAESTGTAEITESVETTVQNESVIPNPVDVDLITNGKTEFILLRGEKADEGKQKPVVHLAERLAVKNKDGGKDDRGSDKVGNHAKNDSNGEGEKHEVNSGAPLGEMSLILFVKGDGLALYRHTKR